MPETATPPPDLAAPTAGLARRLCALTYDALLLAAVLIATGYLFSALLPGAGSGWARSLFQSSLFGAGGLYFGWSWSEGRRTLPMKTWHLRLVNTDGSPLSWRLALKRYVFAWASPFLALAGYLALGRWGLAAAALPYLWALVDRDRQFLHDRLARTRIVQATPGFTAVP